MIKTILGRKLGMTRMFAADGASKAVTVIQAGPCTVTQVKTPERDGYSAVQLGFGSAKPKNVTKPVKGHMEKAGNGVFKRLKETRVEPGTEAELGQQVSVEIFEIGEHVDIGGISKGKGFSGTIKRHGFSRGHMTHGCKSIRDPGSTGMCADPGRVIKGKRMAGQSGNKKVTTLNLRIFDIIPEENLLLIEGAVPGAKNGIVTIRKTNRVK